MLKKTKPFIQQTTPCFHLSLRHTLLRGRTFKYFMKFDLAATNLDLDLNVFRLSIDFLSYSMSERPVSMQLLDTILC